MGFFDKLKQGLAKTKQVFSFTKVDENLLDELEEKFEDLDIELYYGGQPLYYYLISVE